MSASFSAAAEHRADDAMSLSVCERVLVLPEIAIRVLGHLEPPALAIAAPALRSWQPLLREVAVVTAQRLGLLEIPCVRCEGTGTGRRIVDRGPSAYDEKLARMFQARPACLRCTGPPASSPSTWLASLACVNTRDQLLRSFEIVEAFAEGPGTDDSTSDQFECAIDELGSLPCAVLRVHAKAFSMLATTHDHPQVRQSAALRLAGFGAGSLDSILPRLLTDSSEDLRSLAICKFAETYLEESCEFSIDRSVVARHMWLLVNRLEKDASLFVRQAAHDILCRALNEDTLAPHAAALERTRQALAREGWRYWTPEDEARAEANRAAMRAQREENRAAHYEMMRKSRENVVAEMLASGKIDVEMAHSLLQRQGQGLS